MISLLLTNLWNFLTDAMWLVEALWLAVAGHFQD
jgi:hypothetical protein